MVHVVYNHNMIVDYMNHPWVYLLGSLGGGLVALGSLT